MKPLDLIQLLADFKEAMAGNVIPDDVKLLVAKEVFYSLPPVSLCVQCPHTRAWVGMTIQAEIDNLKNPPSGTDTETPRAAQDETETVPRRQARKKSLG